MICLISLNVSVLNFLALLKRYYRNMDENTLFVRSMHVESYYIHDSFNILGVKSTIGFWYTNSRLYIYLILMS
jgi:hypothetical protein